MSETKFTKGEWKVFTKDGNYLCAGKIGIIKDGDCIVIADCNDWLATEKRHNANLIAAAPEMYAMLETAVGMFSGTEFAGRAEKLLAKARGEA